MTETIRKNSSKYNRKQRLFRRKKSFLILHTSQLWRVIISFIVFRIICAKHLDHFYEIERQNKGANTLDVFFRASIGKTTVRSAKVPVLCLMIGFFWKGLLGLFWRLTFRCFAKHALVVRHIGSVCVRYLLFLNIVWPYVHAKVFILYIIMFL